MNVRTLKSSESLNYFCTWASQCRMQEQAELNNFAKNAFTCVNGAIDPRTAMNEYTLFADGGLADMYPELRSKLHLLLDDSWDYPVTAEGDELDLSLFGSFEVNEERFPFTAGKSPAERLRMLSERVKACGWRGMGIWISPQKSGEDFDKPFDRTKMSEYWGERIKWCKYADVRYIKADWGRLSANLEARKLLTDLGHEIFPELYIEHAAPHGPFNGNITEKAFEIEDNGPICDRMHKTVKFSDVFRSYDVSEDRLSAATTLERLDLLFKSSEQCFINCEDELYIGAALGCSIGIMRSVWGAKRFHYCRSTDEITAAVKWFDFAPSFAGGEYFASEEQLCDEHFFKDGETWLKDAIGMTIPQYAPAVMARNTVLPTVIAGEKKPFVAASLNPSGAYSVAAVKRCKYYSDTDAPEVICDIAEAARIGIFGSFKKLTFKSENNISRVCAVSLMGGSVRDITADTVIGDKTLCIDGSVIDTFMCASDESENAVMITLE